MTLNRYPIPDILAMLEQGKIFTKLDPSQAAGGIKQVCTHKELFRYTRLPYGISSAPGIFQKAMEQLLQGIPQVSVYIDDILIAN